MLNSIFLGKVLDFTHEGNGVVKVDDLAVFVEDCVIGDLVEFEIIELRKNFAIGKLLKLVEPSPDRVEYAFDVSSLGGGVPLINLKYDNQLVWKTGKVRKDLMKIAGIDIEVNQVIGMGYPFRYRNHTQVPVGIKGGRIVTGYYKKGSNEIIPMVEDYLQPELGDQILSVVRDWMEELEIQPYDRTNKAGIIKHIGIRTNQSNEAMVIIVTSFTKLTELHSLVHKLVKKAPGVISVFQNINSEDGPFTYGHQYRHLVGKEKLVDYIGDLRFEISPNSFFQVNPRQVEVLYNTALEYLELTDNDLVCDIYSGIGTITLSAAKKAKRVYGIESMKAAVDNAKNNAIMNNISNVEFLEDKAEDAFPKLINNGNAINKVILDPPRKGCDKKVIEELIKLSPERIVYVSCNSSTLARDVKLLVEGGYTLKNVQPVDMFPHTPHVECVVLMSRV